MKKTIKRQGMLIALLATLLLVDVSAQDPNLHIYLCFGQSNMEGQGLIEDQDLNVNPRFQVMQALDCSNLGRIKGDWYDAIPPLCQCWSGLSPADYFGRTMVENLPDSVRVGVIVVAIGGCDIRLFDKDIYEDYDSTYTESWFQDKVAAYGGNPYAHLIELAQQAKQDGVIKGILLHQGETNTGETQWPQYVDKVYRDMLADLSLEAESVPLLAGEVVQGESACCASMNNIIATLPEVIPTAHVISSEGCTQQDNAHFDAAGYRKLGFRYAKQMLSLMGIEIAEPRTPPSSVITHPHNNALFQAGKDVTIRAYASQLGGTETSGQVMKVAFYSDSVLIGESDTHESNTFTWVWTGAEAGTHRITARAINQDGTAFTSAGVHITVDSAAFLASGMSAKKGKYLGNIIDNQVRPDYNDYWNAVTAENSCKWGSVEGVRDQMNWTDADKAYQHALDHHLVFRYHVLAWGSQYPEWIEALEPAEFQAEMEEYIASVAERYPLIDMVDVLNENMYINTWNKEEHAPGTPYFREGLGGPGKTGYDWAIWLFKKARHYFPDAKLVINDFEMETSAAGRNEILDLVRVLRDSGLIDGIGTQAHYFNVDNTGASTIKNALDHMAKSGLPIHVTEMDLKGRSITEVSQRSSYMSAFPTYWNHPAVAGITLWGYVEGQTWAQGTGILNSDGSERSAMAWLKSFMKGRPDVGYPFDGVPAVTDPRETLLLNGEFEYDTFAWALESFEGASANMRVVGDAGMSGTEALRICPEIPGTEAWNIQLSQDIPLEAGKHYLLSFLAKAEAARNLGVAMQRSGGPETLYLQEIVELDQDAQAFSFRFQAPVNDPTNKLKFFAGPGGDCILIDSVVCRELDVTGIQSKETIEPLRLSPNPSKGEVIYLKSSTLAGEIQVDIFSLQGRLLAQYHNSSPGAGIDVSQLTKGIYLVRIRAENHWYSTRLTIL